LTFELSAALRKTLASDVHCSNFSKVRIAVAHLSFSI
jgi:hypothetical protein